MTKPARPAAGHAEPKADKVLEKGLEKVLEIDAIDLAEWERDQHTPQAPSAGLAALVRQTAPPPLADTRPVQQPRPARKAPPPRPPPGLQMMPVAPPARPPPITIDERRLSPVPLPLTAPPSERMASPQVIAPLEFEIPTRLMSVPDHTPTPRAPERSAPPPLAGFPDASDPAVQAAPDQAPPPDLTSSLGSLRMVVIVGGAITAVLIVVAFLALRGSEAPAEAAPAIAATRTAAAPGTPLRSPAPAPAPREAPPQLPAAAPPARIAPPPPPTAPTAPAAAPPVAAPPRTAPVAAPVTTSGPRVEPPAPPPRATRPARTGRAAPKATAAITRANVAVLDEDEPAIAQARVAYAAGNQALFDGDFTAAIASYRRALDYAPSYAPGHRGLGLAYAQHGDAALAVKAFRTYLGLAPRARDVALIKARIAGLQPARR